MGGGERNGDTPFGAIEASVERTWSQFQKTYREVRAGGGETEAVHRYRVSMRRLLAILETFEPVLRAKPAAKAREQLKRRLKALGPLRDLQIHRELFAIYLADEIDLAEFGRQCAREERRLFRRAKDKLGKPVPRSVRKSVDEVLGVLRESRRTESGFERRRRTLLRGVHRWYGRVEKYRGALDADEPETIHRLRLAMKRFRYACELLRPLIPGMTEADFESLRRFQDGAGAVQDLSVLIERIQTAGKKDFIVRAAAGVPGALEHLLTARRERIAEFLRENGRKAAG